MGMLYQNMGKCGSKGLGGRGGGDGIRRGVPLECMSLRYGRHTNKFPFSINNEFLRKF